MNTIELTNQEMILVEGGGMSPKSALIGIGLSCISPILGAGYWIGYYVNS